MSRASRSASDRGGVPCAPRRRRLLLLAALGVVLVANQRTSSWHDAPRHAIDAPAFPSDASSHSRRRRMSATSPHVVVRDDGALAIEPDPDRKISLTVYLCRTSRQKVLTSFVHSYMLQRFGSGRVEYDFRSMGSCHSVDVQPPSRGPCLAAVHVKNAGRLQSKFPGCKLMVLGDEYCRARVHSDVRLFHSLEIPDSVYLPLGPRVDSWNSFWTIRNKHWFSMAPASKRQYAFNAIFSKDTNKHREMLAELIEARQKDEDNAGALSVYTHISQEFSHRTRSDSTEQMITDRYMKILADSALTLAPAGHSLECYRLHEAVETGSIPVVARSDAYVASGEPHPCRGGMDHWYDSPAVVLDDWTKLYPTVEALMEDPRALDERQARVQEWYKDYMTRHVAAFEEIFFEQDDTPGELGPPTEAGISGLLTSLGKRAGLIPPVSDDPSCDLIFLYIPGESESLEVQFNNYVLSSAMATFMDRALVVLERRGPVCDDGLPRGASRLLQVPEWLSRSCPIPCQKSHDYMSWTEAAGPLAITCADDNRRTANVYAVTADQIRRLYKSHFERLMLRRPSPLALDWALRLGATGAEAERFAELEGDRIWSHLSALLARSLFSGLWPGVERDVGDRVKDAVSSHGLEAPYDAIYIRRERAFLSDVDVTGLAKDYWESRGYWNFNVERQRTFPLMHYLRHYNAMGCGRDVVHRVHIITDDIDAIRREIDELGPRQEDGSLLMHNCYNLNVTASVQPAEPDSGGSCEDGYKRDVSSLANLVLLERSATFVGEFHSHLGRLVRLYRTKMDEESNAVQRDIKVAWGYSNNGSPGL